MIVCYKMAGLLFLRGLLLTVGLVFDGGFVLLFLVLGSRIGMFRRGGGRAHCGEIKGDILPIVRHTG